MGVMYINDDFWSNIKLFVDDTSLFSVTHDGITSADELNAGLAKIYDWVFQWKMSFTSDPSKQTQEVISSQKQKNYSASIIFYNSHVSQTTLQKYYNSTKKFICI